MKAGNCCCNHDYRTGSNVLPDGGFESTGGGPGGNEVPGFADIGGLVFPWLNWSDSSQVPIDPPGFWWQADSAGIATPWVVSTASPHSGTKHLRQVLSGATAKNILYCTNQFVCPELSQEYLENGGTSLSVWQVGQVVVRPGDVWQLDFWAKVSAAVNSNSLRVWAEYSNNDDTDIHADGYVYEKTLTTSYSLFTIGGVVPTSGVAGFDAELMSLQIQNNWVGNSGSTTLDIDTVSLGLA